MEFLYAIDDILSSEECKKYIYNSNNSCCGNGTCLEFHFDEEEKKMIYELKENCKYNCYDRISIIYNSDESNN